MAFLQEPSEGKIWPSFQPYNVTISAVGSENVISVDNAVSGNQSSEAGVLQLKQGVTSSTDKCTKNDEGIN